MDLLYFFYFERERERESFFIHFPNVLKFCPLKFNIKFQIFMEAVQCLRACSCFPVSVTKHHVKKQLIKERVDVGICLQSCVNLSLRMRHGDILTCQHEVERAEGSRVQGCGCSKPAPSNVLPAVSLHVSRHSHQLRTKCLEV